MKAHKFEVFAVIVLLHLTSTAETLIKSCIYHAQPTFYHGVHMMQFVNTFCKLFLKYKMQRLCLQRIGVINV